MPLSRYKVGNEYCLGSRELYLTAARNEPEAVLEGVAMAGFVGILRQLGDLAQLAAEVFHDLHDQVMAASARGHELTLRVQQLEEELPLIEKDFCQKEHCMYVAPNTDRVDWRANLKVSHGIVAAGSTPCFIVEYIKRCRGPPKLSVLDKYDTGGEGACLNRYTNPSFFRADSASSTKLQGGTKQAKISPKILEIRPTFQSSENSKPPKAAHTCSKSETDASDKASDRFLAMFRQLKYRHRQINGSVFRSMKPQTQNFHKEDSSEEKAYAIHHSEVYTSSTDSPEPNIQVTDITVGAASVNEEKTCDLERTSSFEAWLSPDAHTPESEITEEASHDTYNEFVSHATSNGTLVAAGTKKAKENSKTTEEVSYKKGVNKMSMYKGSVEFITSRISNLPRKLLVKKHDPLTGSFRNMAKKLLELKYDTVRNNESYDFEQDISEDYDAKCLEMSQSNLSDETKEERNVTENVPSDLARHSHDSCERQPAQAAAPIDTVQDSPADGDVLGRNGNSCSLVADSPSFKEELLALVRASDVPSSPDALDHEPTDRPVHTMKASDKATENSRNTVPSEDVPDLDEVAVLDDKSTEYIQEQMISDAAIVSSPSTSEQPDEPCEACPPGSMDEDASDSVVNCKPETIPKETCQQPDEPCEACPPGSMDEDASDSVVNCKPETIPKETCQQPDEPCEACPPGSMDEDASDSVVNCKPETIPKETCLPILVTNPVFSSDTSVPDTEQCHLQLHPETTTLQSTRGPSYEASVGEELQGLRQPTIHQEPNGSFVPNLCSSSSRSPENRGDPTSTSDARYLLLPSMRSSTCGLNESVHEPAILLPVNGCSGDTKDVTIPPLPPIPPMQWLSAKVHTGSGIASPKLITLRPKSPAINGADKSKYLEPVRTQKTEMIQASSQHSSWTSQTEMAQALVSNENANADFSHSDGVCGDSFLNKGSVEISHRESFRKDPVPPSEGKTLKTMKFPELTVHSDEVRSELVKAEHEDFYLKAREISAAHGGILPVSEANKLRNGDQVDVQNSPACQSNEERSSDVHEESVFSSAAEQLRKMSPPSVPRPKYSVLEVGSHDRSMLRMAPGLIYPSRKLSGERSILLEQIEGRSLSLKPVLGRSSNVMAGPRNSKVATVLQRAHHIRQADADKDDIDSEDSWSGSD